MKQHRIIQLEAEGHPGSVRFVSGLSLTLAEGATRSTVTVTRTGSFRDPRYGQFEITREMLLAMVENFQAGTYGQDIFIDVAHQPSNGAAGKVVALAVEGNRLRATVDWTPFGVESIRDKGYQYLSAEYAENWRDNEQGLQHGPVLLGAALTVRPVIKHLDPVRLSEDSGHPTLLHPELTKTLSEEITTMWKDLIEKLKARFGEFKLAETVAKQLAEAFETAAKALGEDRGALDALFTQFEATGKQLAEAGQSGPVQLAINVPGGKTLSEADINRLLDEREAKRQETAKKLAEGRAANVGLFAKLLAEAEGLKGLTDDVRKQLGEAAELITADMSEAQVRALAEHQIKLGNQLSIQSQLAARGFNPRGTPHITVDESNAVKALQESIDKRLGLTDLAPSRRFSNTGGQLQAENKALAEKVLAQYDADHGMDLNREHKMLAAGDGIVSDVAVPAVFERTVIREALYNLVGLQFVDASTMPFATSALIPYSFRDTTAAGMNSARKYEGQGVARAGVKQAGETAYPIPQKLAFEVSDELRYLTAASIYNWDAVTENQRNASRIIGEDLERLIFNETLQASDEFATTAVALEVLTASVNGTNRVFVLAQFPVARPRKYFDLQGNQVGSTINPVTVTYNSVVRSEYDGTGTQAAGTYYVLNYNTGEIYFVTEAGAIVTPPNATPLTVGYSYTTNVYKFDTDLGSLTTKLKWDDFLYRYGLRKSIVEDQRYYMANFGLMSGTVMTQIEQATAFEANSKRPGTDLMADGNLGRIKDVPNFKTSAPGLAMGDQRVLIGERGQTRLRIMKPWSMGDLENQKDANGRFTGKKEAYGDQYLVLHTPTQLKAAMTSIVLYSATARVNRVNP